MTNLKELKELTKDLKILYVEDDSAIRVTMTSYLEKLFLEVISANDGADGLDAYKKDSFNIVITDLSMPRMNGLDMIEAIKGINKEQAVLITSAHSESDYMFGAIKAGIDGYIIKPFDYEQLNNELFKITQKLKIIKENEDYKLYLKDMVNKKTAELSYMVSFQSDNYEKTLVAMVDMIEQRDTYTAGHSKRVAQYCETIARSMGYSEEECTMIHQAGILHDVGKIGTPDAVLLNPKTLNSLEYKLIQEHVVMSYKLLNNIPMFEPLAEIIHSHHERYDGGGYPKGLKSDEIAPLSRIMIVADAFDAMTTNRIYKSRKSVDEALEELVSLSSKQFHPEVVEKAVIALRDTEIDETISQLPKTKLEEERFAYFYNDTLSSAYNQNYLDVILMKNNQNFKLKNMEIIMISNFSKYNKEHSWKEGDKLLSNFSNTLCSNLTGASIFRVFGDDFVVLSEEKLDFSETKKELDKVIKDRDITYQVKSIDLSKVRIDRASQIENYKH